VLILNSFAIFGMRGSSGFSFLALNFREKTIAHSKKKIMPIVKVIEVISSSEKGIEDAIQNALSEASKTVRNIDSIYVKDIKVHVKDNKITTYGLICKISFRLEH